MIDEEKKYDKLIDDLKKLPKVNAPQNFETNLWRKINSSEKNKKESFWSKIFTPGKLIPAAAVLASAVIIFFLVDVKSGETENPLNLQPGLKEDLIIIKPDEKAVVPLKESKATEVENRKFEEERTTVMPKSAVMDKEIILKEGVSEIKDNAITGGSEAESINAQQQTSVMGLSSTDSAKKTSVSDLKKDSLNFLQINPSIKEKKEIERLNQSKKGTEKTKSK